MAEYRASAGSVADITAPKPEYSSLDPGFTNWCFEWSRKTYLESYESQGRRDPKWDEIVRPALSNYARLRVTDEALTMEHRRDFQRAVDAGCDDPLVVYLYTRVMYDPDQATRKTAVKYTMVARQLDNSHYAGLIQCFGHLRAAQAWRNTDTNKPPQVNEHRGLAFDRYFSLHETDNGWRHNYILGAYRCRQWPTLNEELNKLEYVNCAYFGGEEEFNRMKAEAESHAQK